MEHNRVVYMPSKYDAEIEYLESTGTQYMYIPFTLIKGDNAYFSVYITETNLMNGNTIFMSSTGSKNNYGCSFLNRKIWFVSFTGNGVTGNNIYYDYNVWRNISIIYNANGNKYTFNVDNTNLASQTPAYTSVSGIYLFCRNNLLENAAKARISNLKIKRNGNYILDLIPVRKGSTGYMYDKVSGRLFGNKGTGNFVLGPDVANPVPNIRRVFRFGNKRFVMPMPYDKRVEYLESNGTQFIRLGSQSLPAQTKVEYKAKGSTSLNSNSRVISYGSVSDKNNFTIWEQKTKFYASMLGSEVAINSNQVTSEHTIVQERVSTTSGTFSINGNVSNINGNYIEKSGNLALLANNVGEQSYLGKIYYLKLWTNNMLIYDLIPVRRGNVGYMYDKVSGKLFGNAGTGQFILGNDIND